MRGYFISFEGIDGSGKSTQIQLLAGYLSQNSYQVAQYREPGGTPVGENIRALLLDAQLDIETETQTFLLTAARAEGR